jgi:hypothetical protein
MVRQAGEVLLFFVLIIKHRVPPIFRIAEVS